MKIYIFDLQYANYTKASTPKPSASVMLASGYHKAKGDTVIFSSEPPKNFAIYDLIYINKDIEGLFHLQEWLDYPNVKPIGDFWHKDEIYFDERWTEFQPDITIYHDWIKNFMAAVPRKREKLFETFFEYTPFLMKRKNGIVEPSGDKILILDRNWASWENGFELISELDIKKIRFVYPIPIDSDYEKACSLIYNCKNIIRDHVWLELTGIIPKDKQIDMARTFKKYKLGRNIKVKWKLDFENLDAWWSNLLPAADMFETFLREGKKYLFCSAPEHLYLPDEELKALWGQFQNWTLFRLKNTRNNVIDNWIFYGISDYNKIMEFLKDPITFVSKKQKGQASMTRLLNLIEREPHIVYELSRTQRAPVGIDPGYGVIKLGINVESGDDIHPMFLPFVHNLFSNDLYAKSKIQTALKNMSYTWETEQ